MKIKLAHKIFLLIFIVIVIISTVGSYFYYSHLKIFAQSVAVKSTYHIIDVFIKDIKHKKEYIRLKSEEIINNKTMLASINLISNYQDINNYESIVFDQEKIKIYDQLNSITHGIDELSFTLFDKNLKPVVFHTTIDKKTKKGIESYFNGKKIYLDIDLKTEVTFNCEIPKKEDIDKAVFAKYSNDKIIIKMIKTLYSNNSISGYIELRYFINKKNIKEFASHHNEDIWLLSKDISIGSKDDLTIKYNEIKDLKEIMLIEKKDSYYLVYDMKQNDNKFYTIARYSKKELNIQVNDLLFKMLSIVLIVLIATLLISSYFTNKYIVSPLNLLIDGMRSINNKSIKLIDVPNKDEIGDIANEFNILSKKLQESILEVTDNNTLLNNMLDNLPIRVFIKSVDGRYIKANKLLLQDFGMDSEQQIFGKKNSEIPLLKNNLEKYNYTDNEVVNNLTRFLKYEENFIDINGKEHILLKSKVPLLNAQNDILGILVMYDDITEQKSIESKLKEKDMHLLQQSKLAQMGEMISMIAHQWRQPLGAISSTANSLLLKVTLDKYQEDFFESRLQNISDYSQHLSSTIDDFRNFFKKHKEQREISPAVIVEDCLKIIQTSIENKDIKIIKNFTFEKEIVTYPNEVRQVILNLIKNAEDALIDKQQDEKFIKLSVYENNDKCVIEISDNAGGISDDIIDKIYNPYFSTKEEKDGTGLGLYMSKTIIEEHCKGKISVINDNNGAIFKVIL